MSRQTSATATFISLVAALVAIFVLVVLGLRQIDRAQAANDWVLHTRLVLAQADEVRQLLLDAEAAVRGYAVSADGEFQTRYANAVAQLPPAIRTLGAYVNDNAEQAQRVAALTALIEVRLKHLNDIVQARERAGAATSQQLVASSIGEAVSKQVRDALAGVRGAEHALFKARTDEATEEQRAVRTAFIGTSLTCVLFILVAGYTCRSSLKARSAAERLSRMGEARLRSTLSSCGDGLIVTDDAGKVTMINPIAEALTGWRAEQAQGAPIEEVFRIVNEYTRETVESPVSRVLREGKVVGLANHTILLARDGTERPIDDSGAPIRVDDQTVGVILVFRDVTSRKLSEQARERLLLAESEREAAVRANEAKDQFLALVSHELRSPLAAIHGWVSLLQRNALPARDVPNALQRIARNVNQQQRVISDLLDVSRILTGKLEIVRAPVDLGAIVRESVEECRAYAESKGIALTLVPFGEKLILLADEQRLRQVSSNLIGNAIKFTPHGGSARVTLTGSNGWAELRIADTGVGMTADELEHVFERFWQAQRATTRTNGGLGLGLALAQYIVEQHGGRIAADSPGPNLGATFTIRFPLLAPEPNHPSDKPVGELREERLQNLAVLVVDDELDVRESMARLLEIAGATVHTAPTARDALEIHRSRRVDVVVTDLGMPGDDGFSLLRSIRVQEADAARRTPVIALTGFVGTQDKSNVRDAGFTAHLDKPVDIQLLVAAIASAAESQKAPS